MTKQKGLLLLSFLTASSILYSQPTDSLQTVPVPKYVLYRMFHDISTGRVCDSLVTAQDSVISGSQRLVVALDSLVKNKDAQIENHKLSQTALHDLYLNQVKMTKVEKAEKRKWKLATFAGGALIILITIL